MTKTLSIRTKTDPDGHLRLDMPLAKSAIGISITVVFDENAQSGRKPSDYPLRSKAIRYERPFEGVAEKDWEALQ